MSGMANVNKVPKNKMIKAPNPPGTADGIKKATNSFPKSSDVAPAQRTSVVIFARVLAISLLIISFVYQDTLQHFIDTLWQYQYSSAVFNSVYFETWWATVCYALLIPIPWLCFKIPLFDQYKLDKNVRWESPGIVKIMQEGIEYCLPLMTLDTFMTKMYTGHGIDPAEWQTRRANWIQYTRALPEQPPSLFQVVWHLAVSFILYDIMFFAIHFSVHKNRHLYKYIHEPHHKHESFHGRVTNQLTVAERIMLVLSANQALRSVHAHPLTRFLFVPLFIWGLVENHLGYDFPWSFDKVVPFGLLGGARSHYAHHVHGSRHYQPFFTYIDNYIVPRLNRHKKQHPN